MVSEAEEFWASYNERFERTQQLLRQFAERVSGECFVKPTLTDEEFENLECLPLGLTYALAVDPIGYLRGTYKPFQSKEFKHTFPKQIIVTCNYRGRRIEFAVDTPGRDSEKTHFSVVSPITWKKAGEFILNVNKPTSWPLDLYRSKKVSNILGKCLKPLIPKGMHQQMDNFARSSIFNIRFNLAKLDARFTVKTNDPLVARKIIGDRRILQSLAAFPNVEYLLWGQPGFLKDLDLRFVRFSATTNCENTDDLQQCLDLMKTALDVLEEQSLID
jgi:hypothetical protein